MNDLGYGSRDKRGHWEPAGQIEPGPLFAFPPRPRAVAGWLFGYPGYFLPWNVAFIATALLTWTFLTPSWETMRTLAPGWIAWILARNAAMTFLFFGAFHLRLYILRRQGTLFKYNPRWPATGSKAFLFGSQTRDNIFRTFSTGVPIWTAYEVLTLWAFSNGVVPWMGPGTNPVWLIALMALVPLIHEFHFYLIHRLIHWPPLYRTVHHVHHANVNPGPWSSLAMHPVEQLLYFSGVLIHWILPSHPLLAIYHLQTAGLGSVVGHLGFDRIVVGEVTAIETHTRAHYLHHKYFEVNYADGAIPLDRWFGTWHDGSDAAAARMRARLAARSRKARGKTTA